MAELVADYVLKRLREWGVERIYGYPGDGINAFLGALDRAEEQGGPEFIQARHEEMAAFMACGAREVRRAGRIGVCMATSGPGAVHLLNGLYDAKLDHVPVLAIVGQQKRTSLGAHYQQEIDLQTLFKDVSEFVEMCTEPEQARASDRPRDPHRARPTHRAARSSSRTTSPRSRPSSRRRASTAPSTPPSATAGRASLPQENDIQHAAEILNEGEKVAILIGQGARGAATRSSRSPTCSARALRRRCSARTCSPDDLP